jgi:hypothetical protein
MTAQTPSIRSSTANRRQYLGVVSLVALFLLTALFSLESDPNAASLDASLRQSAAQMDAGLNAIAQFLPGAFARNSE